MTALLLKHGARLGDQDSQGHTPLMLACSRGLYLPALELLDAGAVVNQANWSTGLTPVMLVVSQCNSSGSGKTVQFAFLHQSAAGTYYTEAD